MEELIPWERLADHQVLQAGSHETVESLRRRLVEMGEHAQRSAPILIRVATGQVAPTSVPALLALAQQRGAYLLRMRLESLLPELCPEPWATEGEAEALAMARRRGLPVVATGEGTPVALALAPPRLPDMAAPGSELFDLFDQPLTPAAAAGPRFVVATPESTAAEVAAALGQGLDGDGTFVLLQAGDSFHVLDRRLEQGVPDFPSRVWPRNLAELRPRLEPAEARPYRELGIQQARAIAERIFLVLLDEEGLAVGLMPPPPGLAGQVLPAGADHDLFDPPLAPEGVDLPQTALPGAPFVLAAPDTLVARVATDLKKLTEEEARRAYVLVRAGDGSYAVVSAQELNDDLISAGPEPWGQPLRQVVPRLHPAHVCALEMVGSRQVRNRAQGPEPLVLLRQGRPWRLLPGALEGAVRGTGGVDLFTVPQKVLDPYLYLRAYQGTLEMLPQEQQQNGAGSGEATEERSTAPGPVTAPQHALLPAARDSECFFADSLGHRLLSLLVDHAPGGYHVDLMPSQGQRQEGELHPSWRARLRREDLAHLVAKARCQLTNISRSAAYETTVEVDEPARTRALLALALVGRQLYLKLFEDAGPGPAGRGAAADVARRIQQEAGEGAVLRVVHRARDFVFPWGLVYDRPLRASQAGRLEVALDGFWGYRFEIEVLTEELLQVPSRDGLVIGQGDGLQVAVGLNDRLAGAREERQLFAALAGAGGGSAVYSVVNRGAEWLRLLTEGRHQLLYLYCHGFTERSASDLALVDNPRGEFQAYLGSLPPERRAGLQDQAEALFDVSESWIKLTDDQVPLTLLQDCAPGRLPTAPLVVLNMCDSAQVLPSLSGGFVPFFLERGARGVIATDCPVPSTFAHALACEFFPRIREGRPVGRVLWELRRAFLEMGNALGLAYTLYGQGGTRLAVPAPPDDEL